MRTGWVSWAAPAVVVGVVVACGSSEDKKSKGKPDPEAGAGGESPQGGRGGSGATGGGGRGGNPTGGSATGGSGGAGEGGDPSTGGTSGDAGSGGEAGATSGAGGAGGDGGAPPTPSVTLTISGADDVHAISPRIYGINPGSAACSDGGARFGACRLGGNPWSTYNWENNASNAGADRCHENNAALGASSTPAEPATALVAQADVVDAAAVITVPMLGYVAADKTAGTAPPACSGDVQNSGSSYLDTRFKVNRARKGSALSPTPDTSDAFVNQDEFVSLVQSAATGVPLVFALDNQPDLWSVTHPRLHPTQATYAEVVAKTTEYAGMIRDVAPNAEISSYVGYGYAGFVNLQDAPDRAGNGEFIDYFLTQMSSASTTAGRRLIDYLDVHWYSEVYVGTERILTEGATPELVAARVQAPRSLWDPSFVEDSWITGFLGGNAIQLIPWLKQKIAARYPATKLAISEWNYGGGTHVSGAIAAADALGIFGRESVDLAAFESLTDNDPFVIGAFRAFRNYDGSGAEFGDRSVRARSSDVALASVYASIRSADSTAMVLVAINKSDSIVDATIEITHTTTYTTAKVYRITSMSPNPTASADLATTNANEFLYPMPPLSVSVIVPND
jgi:hypothetical protein